MLDRKHVICRACHAQCGLVVDFEDGVPVATHGDKDNPAYFGYSCIRGRELAQYHAAPTRLLQSQKRVEDGTYAGVPWQQAAEEAADRIASIVDQHGPDSVAMYLGTFGFNNFLTHAFALAFMEAIGSAMIFNPSSIDQPGKAIAGPLHGPWLAGPYRVDEWDGAVLVGTNPIISMNGGLGMNPARHLHEGKKRGMQLIVIDPRLTETARKADIHLQCRPGQDAVILAAMARQIIEDDLYDADFVLENTQGLEALKAALAPFNPRDAAERAGLTPEEIIAAARMQAGWKRGSVSVGTGPNMAGFGNIAEYLGLVLTSLLGHWRRAGEVRRNSGVFIKPMPPMAASPGPGLAMGYGKKLRIRGLEQTAAGLPTGALADEILTPGEGQVKALIVIGGNPVLAWPDQIRTHSAMQALDLLVCFDPRMSETARLADYVIAPKMPYEVIGNTALIEYLGNFVSGWGFERAYGQISAPIMETPAGSDLVEEYQAFHAMAARMDKTLTVKSLAPVIPAEAAAYTTEVNKDICPPPLTAWDMALNGAPKVHSQIYADPAAHKGCVIEGAGDKIQDKPEGWPGKLAIANEEMMEELADVATTLGAHDSLEGFPFRLLSRRINEFHNSNWRENSAQRRKLASQKAYMHPTDIVGLGLVDGDVIEITSARASIQCVVAEADDVRPGCLSVPHGWGGLPDEADDPFGMGGNTGKLSFADRDYDKRTGIPRMSAIPVHVRAAERA